MLSFERLKEDIRNVEYDLEYGEEQNQGRIAVNVNCLRSVINFANETIAHQSVTEMAVCPNCNGSGVYQEYDEYDRYYVHACGTCDGTGEIARQSVKSEEVAEAISWLTSTGHSNQYMSGNWTAPMKNHINRVIQETILTALQAYQPWVSVEDEKPESGKHVLLCCEVRPSGKRYVCDGFYAKSKSITSGCSDDLDCEYGEETDEHYLPEGYYEVIKNWDDYSSIVIYDFVTLWKPLPEPPKG